MAYSGEDELNALVDSILQSRTDSANVSQVAPPQPSNSPSSTSSPSYGVSHSKASSTRHREHTATTYASSKDAEATAAAYGTHLGGHERALNNLVVVVPAAHGSSASGSRATAMHAADDADYYHDDHDDDDDDLNTLVERILAGRGSRRPPSPSSRHTTLPQHASSSAATTSPATSSLQRPAPQQQQQQQQWGSSGTSTTSRLAGATRVEAGSHSLSRHSGGGGGGTSARMHAVVRRLALWQERREAKRVQAVYEALEREHQDCPFEPAIHHLPTVEAEDRRGDSARYPASHTNTISMSSSSSSSSASPPPLCEYVPSLQPLQQPVTGADAFVERLRRVQEERDALREAAEAQRLHFYDATSFRRDLTVPVPFELGDTRPRRVATATAAVAGVPSPLRRSVGRGGPPPPSPPNARTAATLSVHRSAAAAGAGTSPSIQRGGGGGGGRPADEEDERLTAENTFLSLAPLIRKTLLFDQRMEAQLQRATNSIRRTSGGE
ncbi:hypothetical protein NESM_000699300 [Novymonas esmeraldas]|uniref:Uncharacterized protein n=1 Tax=Novymonas esmeraldas TaxID=1808958 RepID=A0AAW0ETX9_9TRYP